MNSNYEKYGDYSLEELIDRIEHLEIYEYIYLRAKAKEMLSMKTIQFMGGMMIIRWYKMRMKGEEPYPQFSKTELRRLSKVHPYKYSALHTSYRRLLEEFKSNTSKKLDSIASYLIEKSLFPHTRELPGEVIFSEFLERRNKVS